MLLHWCTLQPSGPSNLAAIRFSSPARVRSILVFPTNTKPFAQNPEVVACTEPESFFLDVYLNAQAVHQVSSDVKPEKPRAANALISTVLAYSGGIADFTIDMGPEYTSRLMIIKGKFESISMAIYGDVISESTAAPTAYQPRELPVIDALPISRAVDPANSLDPASVTRQLLSINPDSVPLPLIIRLMLCLKAPNEDWDLEDFPFLHFEPDEDVENLDLEQVYKDMSKPVSDDIPLELLQSFAARVAFMLGPKSSNQSYFVAGILSRAASQHPQLIRCLLHHIDLELVFDAHNMDEATILRLLDAATNADTARHLDNPWFLSLVDTIKGSTNGDKKMQAAARRLRDRIIGWQVFEDALSNKEADFYAAAEMLKDIGTEEASCGIWVNTMLMHPELVSKLAESVVPTVLQPPPFLLGDVRTPVTHDQFVAFVRAYLGVASVLVVWCWSDSVPYDRCRERTMGILRMWQGVEGYRQVLNHLLLLPQMSFRLECMTDNDPPTRSGAHAEHLLYEVADDPKAILRPDLISCILSLRQPLSFISEDERLSLRKAALVAEDGLPAALEELIIPRNHPMSKRRIRTLRVSLAIIARELGDADSGEWRVFQTMWDEHSHGLVPRLIDLLMGVGEDLKGHFSCRSIPQSAQQLIEHLFRMAGDIIKILALLVLAHPLTSRSTRGLTTVVADIFVCTDAVSRGYSPTNLASIAAQGARQLCTDLLQRLSDPDVFADPGKASSEIIMRTLLEHGLAVQDVDPAFHVLQVFRLFDDLLPHIPESPPLSESSEMHWVISVLANLLPEVTEFFRVLDPENKIRLVERLVSLDCGYVGIGEWLLLNELKQLTELLQSLSVSFTNDPHRQIRQQYIVYSLRFLAGLLEPSTGIAAWCLNSLHAVEEASQILSDALLSLLDYRLSSPHLTNIAKVLAQHADALHADLQVATMLVLLREAQGVESQFPVPSSVVPILASLCQEDALPGQLRIEIGRTFTSIAKSESLLNAMDGETAEIMLSILEELGRNSIGLSGITSTSLEKICDHMQPLLPTDRQGAAESIKSQMEIDGEEFMMADTTEIPQTCKMSLRDLEHLLNPPAPVPSTPKGNNTPDVLGLVAVSPPIALLRSPTATLTKTYTRNDFRQLRQLPSARQNTSRLPSMHVDEFELGASSPPLLSVAMPDVFGLHNFNAGA